MKNSRKILAALLTVLLCGCSVSGNFTEETTERSAETYIKQDKDLGTLTYYICDAEKLSELEIEYDPVIDIKKLFEEDKDPMVSRIKNELRTFADKCSEEESYLYRQNGCYISPYGMAVFNAETNNSNSAVQCFMFTEDLQEFGEVIFADRYWNIDHSLAFYYKPNGSRSEVLRKLSQNPDEKYVVLTAGHDQGYAYLDSENEFLLSPGHLSERIKISGDCWSVLDEAGFSVSYNEIVDSDDLIWIEF